MRNQDDMAAFGARYVADIDYAAELLAQIVDHLEVHDPNAILFVFGDHGPVLTQGMDPSDDLPFYITDRYATIGGVFPSHRCASHLGPPADRAADYTTTLDAMHGILRCLSGGRSATRTQRADRMIVRQGLPYEGFCTNKSAPSLVTEGRALQASPCLHWTVSHYPLHLPLATRVRPSSQPSLLRIKPCRKPTKKSPSGLSTLPLRVARDPACLRHPGGRDHRAFGDDDRTARRGRLRAGAERRGSAIRSHRHRRAALGGNEYAVEGETLTIFDVPDACRVQIVTRIKPEQNSALEGLYKSGTMYCTQCEPRASATSPTIQTGRTSCRVSQRRSAPTPSATRCCSRTAIRQPMRPAAGAAR